jgi:hypothetical protein
VYSVYWPHATYKFKEAHFAKGTDAASTAQGLKIGVSPNGMLVCRKAFKWEPGGQWVTRR